MTTGSSLSRYKQCSCLCFLPSQCTAVADLMTHLPRYEHGKTPDAHVMTIFKYNLWTLLSMIAFLRCHFPHWQNKFIFLYKFMCLF